MCGQWYVICVVDPNAILHHDYSLVFTSSIDGVGIELDRGIEMLPGIVYIVFGF